MRQLLAAFATGLFFLAAPAFGQDRIPVATLNGETIWLDEFGLKWPVCPGVGPRPMALPIYRQSVIPDFTLSDTLDKNTL